MNLKKYHCFWFLLLLLAPVAVTGQFHDADWLEQGLLAEFRGEYEKALNIWSDARNEMDEPDSRVGFEFIRVATEQEIIERYGEATDMYYWAISAPFININRAAVRQEIERLRPLIGDGMYRQWINWFEERNETLASDIRGFWIQLDPTPGGENNERLIEHWSRIAYSRVNFVKNRNTVYSTDDRALIYIRYGEPDDRHTGVLTLDNQNLGHWLARQFESARTIDDPEEDSPVRLEMNRDHEEENRSYEQLEEYVFRFHEHPEFEIWVYEPLTEAEAQPLIFIFGTDVQTGDYHKQVSIDDFIPQRAYLSDRRSQTARTEFIRQGFTPALALQMLYYEQLVDINPFFGERLSQIRESFIDQGSLAYQSLDLALKSQNREMLEIRINEAPREVSSFNRLLPRIPVEVHQYRLLDAEDNPVIISFIESNPVNALQMDLEVNKNLNTDVNNAADASDIESAEMIYDDYHLDHKLIIYDSNWNELERNEHAPVLTHVSDGQNRIAQSVFISMHDRQYFQSAAARLINRNPASITYYPSIFPDELRGLGTLKNRQPPPLVHDPGQLELGDLILGFYDDIPDDYPFNFRVANDQMIPGDQSLLLHFEVYNLMPRPNGFTHFELTYRIYPVLEDGTLLTDEEAFYLTINFEHDETRVVEDLEIQTTQLSSGLYELQVMVEDMQSGQEQRRDIRFEVTN